MDNEATDDELLVFLHQQEQPSTWPGEDTTPSLVIYGQVVVTANRGGEEPRRLVRLSRVAMAILDNGSSRLRRLHDHKGQLSADFESPPTIDEVKQLTEAWENEGEPVLEGIYIKGKLVIKGF